MAVLRSWMAEARRLEASGDLPGAVSIYRKTLARQEQTRGLADLSVHNGLGDLYLRSGRVDDAIEAFENAVRQCEEQQLYANGIALCKKILRNAPNHTPTYRCAARLSALLGLDAEARLNYSKFREQLSSSQRESEALDALREIVEITADEESTVELAETLVEHGERGEALELLRTMKDRRQEDHRGVVNILRAIQELQHELELEAPEPSDPRAEHSDDAPDVPIESVQEAAETQEAWSALLWTPGEPPIDRPDANAAVGSELPDSTARATAPSEISGLLQDLDRRLSEIAGDEQARRALVLIDQMLDLDPGQFDLLSRKLRYAFILRDERVVAEAYLELGASLDRELEGVNVRTLSSSSRSGTVTAAVQVEEVSRS